VIARKLKRYTARPLGSAENANALFISGHISLLNENNRKYIISDLKLLRKVGSSSLQGDMLREPNDLIATAATLFMLQRESETHAALLHKKLDQSRQSCLSRTSRSIVFALTPANSLDSE